eukprot:jgi/Botrbrau1/3941/Bobra.0365s0016.1
MMEDKAEYQLLLKQGDTVQSQHSEHVWQGWESLPEPLLEIIGMHLSVPDLKCAALACKAWTAPFRRNMTGLQLRVDALTRMSLRKQLWRLRRDFPCLSSLDLTHACCFFEEGQGYADAVLAEAVGAFPQLRSLKLEGSCLDMSLLLPLRHSLTRLEVRERAFFGSAQAASVSHLQQLRQLAILQEPELEPAAMLELRKLTGLQSLQLGGAATPALQLLLKELPALAHLCVQSGKGAPLHFHTLPGVTPLWLT